MDYFRLGTNAARAAGRLQSAVGMLASRGIFAADAPEDEVVISLMETLQTLDDLCGAYMSKLQDDEGNKVSCIVHSCYLLDSHFPAGTLLFLAIPRFEEWKWISYLLLYRHLYRDNISMLFSSHHWIL